MTLPEELVLGVGAIVLLMLVAAWGGQGSTRPLVSMGTPRSLVLAVQAVRSPAPASGGGRGLWRPVPRDAFAAFAKVLIYIAARRLAILISRRASSSARQATICDRNIRC